MTLVVRGIRWLLLGHAVATSVKRRRRCVVPVLEPLLFLPLVAVPDAHDRAADAERGGNLRESAARRPRLGGEVRLQRAPIRAGDDRPPTAPSHRRRRPGRPRRVVAGLRDVHAALGDRQPRLERRAQRLHVAAAERQRLEPADGALAERRRTEVDERGADVRLRRAESHASQAELLGELTQFLVDARLAGQLVFDHRRRTLHHVTAACHGQTRRIKPQ